MMMRSVASLGGCEGETATVGAGAAAAAEVMGGAIGAEPKVLRGWLANKSAKGSDGVPNRDAGGGVGVAVMDGQLRVALPPFCRRSLINASSGSAARVGYKSSTKRCW